MVQVAKWRRDRISRRKVLCVLELALLATITSSLQLWLPAFGTCKPCISHDDHSELATLRLRDAHPLRLPHLPFLRDDRPAIPDALRLPPDPLAAAAGLHTLPFTSPASGIDPAAPASALAPAGDSNGSIDGGGERGPVERQGCAQRLHRPLYIKYYGCPESHYNDLAVLLFSDNNQVIAANIEITHAGAFTVKTMAIYTVFVFVFAALSYGSTIPSGIFTPNLLIGSALGCVPPSALRSRRPPLFLLRSSMVGKAPLSSLRTPPPSVRLDPCMSLQNRAACDWLNWLACRPEWPGCNRIRCLCATREHPRPECHPASSSPVSGMYQHA